MKRLIAALALIGLVGGYLVAPAEAQGRFWVLVNGVLRYTGRVQINSGPVLFPNGTSGAPSMAFASEPTLGFYRSFATVISVSGGNTLDGTVFQVAQGGNYTWANRGSLIRPADGQQTISNNANTIGTMLKVDALPTVSSCGAGSPAVTAGSTPLSGSVTVGTGGPITCTITYGGTAFPSAPHCTGSVETITAADTRAIGYSSSTTVLTIVPAAAWADSSVVNWHCIGSK